MRTGLVRFAMALNTAVAASWALLHCGGDDASRRGTDAAAEVGADSTAQDAPARDGTPIDRTAPEAAPSLDSGAGDATLGDGSDAADAADAVEDTFTGIPCTPLSGDAGDAGDSGDEDATGAQSDASEAGTVEDAGASASDAGEAAATIGICPGALTCCGGWCVDTKKDPRNCGSCGNACASKQFCTGMACDDAVLKNVCSNPLATVVDDPYTADNAAGGVLGAALMSGCTPGVTVLTTAQDSGIAEDPASGRPLAGPGDTLVAGGGYFGQAAVSYMEQNALAPLYLGTDGTNAWIRISTTNANVVYTPNAMLTMHHDYFVLEVSVEPVSGTLCFFGYGMLAPGTTAAAYFFQNSVVGNRAMFSDAWYVYEWTDTNNDGTPSAGDTFNLVSSGS